MVVQSTCCSRINSYNLSSICLSVSCLGTISNRRRINVHRHLRKGQSIPSDPISTLSGSQIQLSRWDKLHQNKHFHLLSSHETRVKIGTYNFLKIVIFGIFRLCIFRVKIRSKCGRPVDLRLCCDSNCPSPGSECSQYRNGAEHIPAIDLCSILNL